MKFLIGRYKSPIRGGNLMMRMMLAGGPDISVKRGGV